ncbi:MAG: tRNA (adenosine(37)-N6)-dimethylallyltransferase MiaA [Clostridia bacterium]
MKPKVICIVGPTASGKTGLSIEVAKKINGEIISADSMQIYKGLDIATAKIKRAEMEGIKHYLIDICSIEENFSVADFKIMCYDKIQDIISKDKVPIIVGGTGLYISAIVNDMNFEEQVIDENYRAQLYNLSEKYSNEYVHNILKKIDPQAAANIHSNNLKRVIRAIEIAKYSNKTKSEHMKEEKSRIDLKDVKYDFKIFCIDFPRQNLYERINKRVDLMIKQGLEEEAKMVFDKKLSKTVTCMQAIGYKEFFPYFEGEITLEDATNKLKQETRRYAKRQVTWFRNKLKTYSIDGEKNKEELTNEIINNIC